MSRTSLPDSPWPFDETRATEAACILLKAHGGRMGRLRLIKLLYFADREAILRHGRPIVGGRYVSMDHGPVLSEVYDFINRNLWIMRRGIWEDHIKNTGAIDIELAADAPPTDLSDVEVKILHIVCQRFRGMSDTEIRNASHKLPEWHDPGGSSKTIPAIEILESLGLPKDDIDRREQEAAAQARFEQLLRSVRK